MTIEKSDSIVKLAAALTAAQAAIQPAIKSSENPHFRSKYADLASIWDACREPLTKNGLSVVQMPVDASEGGRVALTTILIHNSGEFISSTVSTKLQQDTAQGVGSALTYLRRYALSAMVGVVADEDDDGNAASKPAEQRTTTSTNDNGHAPGKASEKQIKMLFAIWNKAGYEGDLKEWIATTFGCGLNDLSVKLASEAIEALQPEKASAANS